MNQSDYTVQTLRNVTEYLSLAKTINVAQILLPSDVMEDIDNLNGDLNTAADTLSDKTNENSVKIRRVFNAVYVIITFDTVHFIGFILASKMLNSVHFCRRSALIVVAAVMLLLALIGLCKDS